MLSNQKITPFQMGTGSKDPKASVKVKSDMSMSKMGGIKDALYNALSPSKPALPKGMHRASMRKTPHASGSHYEPRGNFGRVAPKKSPFGYSYGKAPGGSGSNSVGNPPGGRGSNANMGNY